MALIWLQEQLQELEKAGRTHKKPHIRIKALAVLAVARGQQRKDVAPLFQVSAYHLGKWVKVYRELGLSGFKIKKGRGPKAKIKKSELEEYTLQTPHNFGLNESRWTLKLIEQIVPSAKGCTKQAIWYALRRAKLGYKRGSPHIHSPDPDYSKKKEKLKKL